MGWMILILFTYGLGSLTGSNVVNRWMSGSLHRPNTTFRMLVLLFDVIKGTLAVVLAFTMDLPWEWALPTAAFFVVLGDIYPVFFRFKGGKGISPTVGVSLYFSPFALFFAGLFSGLAWVLTRSASLAALTFVVFIPVFMVVFQVPFQLVLGIIAISLLILWQYRGEIPGFALGKKGRWF